MKTPEDYAWHQWNEWTHDPERVGHWWGKSIQELVDYLKAQRAVESLLEEESSASSGSEEA